MPPLRVMPLPASNDVVAALDRAYADVTAIVADLDDNDLLLPSGCRGWSIADLLYHMLLDAQRALVAFATPAQGSSDVDYVTYWRRFPGVGDADAALAHGQWVRRSAAAFIRPTGIVPRWTETSAAAAHAAAAADRNGVVTTQDHVLTVPDFVATLVTEAAIHHLDLTVSLPGAPAPAAGAITIALSSMEGLAAPGGLPRHWDAREALLKGSGRAALDDTDRHALGSRADTFPLLS
jgi:Mycothiol maleylpyruvate isomerase N-terminal domain